MSRNSPPRMRNVWVEMDSDSLLFSPFSLILNIFFDDGKWRATSGDKAIGSTPKHRLPIIFSQMLSKFFSNIATRDRFDAIHEFRRLNVWVHLE